MAERRNRLLIASLIAGGLFMASLVGLSMSIISFRVPSSSMRPELPPSSRIWVNRWARSPERGDVIVFGFPENPSQDFVKRVIAVGGDRLEVRDGHPILNGWPVPSCKLGPYEYTDEETIPPHHAGDLYVEFLGAHAYLVFIDTGVTAFANGTYVARSGESWVLGDNRMNSHDSPNWFGGMGGGVPRELLRGRVIGHDKPVLPRDASAALRAELDACLAKKPAQTSPP